MTNVSRLPGPIADVWEWQLAGACRGRDSAQFFHPDGERGASRTRRESAAKAVCRTCPVRAECALHALSSREPYGVWGGFTEAERSRLLETDWWEVASGGTGHVDVARLEARLGPHTRRLPAPRRPGGTARTSTKAQALGRPAAPGAMPAPRGPVTPR